MLTLALFQSTSFSKASFDREIILNQLPEDHEYELETWDVTGKNSFFVEGRVKGGMDVAGGKRWLDELYQTSGANFNLLNGRHDLIESSASGGKQKFSAFRKCAMKVVNVRKGKDTKERQPGKNTDCRANIRIRIETPGEPLSDKASKKQQKEANTSIRRIFSTKIGSQELQ